MSACYKQCLLQYSYSVHCFVLSEVCKLARQSYKLRVQLGSQMLHEGRDSHHAYDKDRVSKSCPVPRHAEPYSAVSCPSHLKRLRCPTAVDFHAPQTVFLLGAWPPVATATSWICLPLLRLPLCLLRKLQSAATQQASSRAHFQNTSGATKDPRELLGGSHLQCKRAAFTRLWTAFAAPQQVS